MSESLDHWAQKARARVGELNTGAMAEKPTLKNLEAEIRRQILACFMHVEKDIDMLHEQLHQDLYHAISKEFVSVAQNLNAIRREAQEGVEDVRAAGNELEKQVVALDYSIQYLKSGEGGNRSNADASLEEMQETLARTEQACNEQNSKLVDVQSELAKLEESCFARLSKLETQYFKEFPSLRDKSASLEDSFVALAVQVKATQDLSSRISEIETRIESQPKALEANGGELPTPAAESSACVDGDCSDELSSPTISMIVAQSLSRITRLEKQLQERVAPIVESAELSACVDNGRLDELSSQITLLEDQLHESVKLAAESDDSRLDELSSRISLLENQLENTTMRVESEAGERALRAGELATSLDACYADWDEKHKQLEEAIDKVANEMPSDKSVEVDELMERVEFLSQDMDASRRDVRFSQACWMRNIDWTANVDLDTLFSTGMYDIESPQFAAAGLRDLRLSLRIRAETSQYHRWTLGVFVRAPEGQVSFRLHVGGKIQSFAADFVKIPEWGSQKIAILDKVEAFVPIRLEILDVVVAVPDFVSNDMVATFCMTDANRVAAREAEAVRSSMVQKIEWRVGHIAERIAAARTAARSVGSDEDALEPLISPVFSAGGLEDLQLHLYPLGYLRRDKRNPNSTFEEKCSFFLVCPKGTYMKCRAFVGDQVKTFEHNYTEREPFGRGNFCRLIDKRDNDDCVVCGVEILEVRQERYTQVKAGPFGNVMEQMKVTLAPGLGNMELMKELRDVGERGPRKPHLSAGPSKRMPNVQSPRIQEEIYTPVGPPKRMANANSLPTLPAAHGGQDASWMSPPNRSKKRIDAVFKV